MDAYLFILTEERLTPNDDRYVGDIIEVRRASQELTVLERTGFYTLKVTGIDPARAASIRDAIHSKSVRGSGTKFWRFFGLNDGTLTKAAVLNYLRNRFGAGVIANLASYFNADTEQPMTEILSIPFATLKGIVRHKLLADHFTDDDIGDVDPVVTP